MKLILETALLLFISMSCVQEIPKKPEANEGIVKMEKSPDEFSNNFSQEEIAKYTISSIMNQPPEIISVKKDGDIYFVSYSRKSDGEKFDYKVRIDGRNIVWGNSDGRWRDTEYDEKISYFENENRLIIEQTFDDGSTINKEFEKK